MSSSLEEADLLTDLDFRGFLDCSRLITPALQSRAISRDLDNLAFMLGIP